MDLNKKLTWVVVLGHIGDHSVIYVNENKFCTEDGQWHTLPQPFSFRANKEEFLAQMGKLADELFKEE